MIQKFLTIASFRSILTPPVAAISIVALSLGYAVISDGHDRLVPSEPAARLPATVTPTLLPSTNSEDLQGNTTWRQRLNESPYINAAWATYRNKEYGFTIRYPDNWVARDSKNDFRIWTLTLQSPLAKDELILNIYPDPNEPAPAIPAANIEINGIIWKLFGADQEENKGAVLRLETHRDGLVFQFSDALFTQTGRTIATGIVRSFQFLW
jgi:hypothetical protein